MAMRRTIRLRGQGSGELVLVGWPGVHRYGAGEAASVLRQWCASNSANASEILALAGGTGGSHHSLEDAIAIVAGLVADGSLALLELEPDHVPRRPFFGKPRSEHDDDWDHIRPLSDLRETDPTVTFGSLSIELVDYTGVPFRNQELRLRYGHGGTDRIVLDELGKWSVRSVPKVGTAAVILPARLELTKEQLAAGTPDGAGTVTGDVTVQRVAPGEVSLPRYDVHTKIVVGPPPKQPTRSFPTTSFASASAFPTAAIVHLVRVAHELTDPDPSVRIGIFGHTDTTDDANANKDLADRRADVAFALLTGDHALFASVAEAEDWPLEHYQAMLRVLGCNPTAIDGEGGVQTERAIAAFRADYNANAWHDEGRARAYGDLPPGNELDGPTKQAIVDAYHAEMCGSVKPERFLGPKRAGCGEFNPLGPAHADNRRVTLAVYGRDAPHDDDFPCKAGDAGACMVDDGGTFRCKFYRERIHEEKVEVTPTPFWDFEWLKTESGKAHLSTLTDLPDTNDAVFELQRWRPDPYADDCGRGPAPAGRETIVKVAGLIRAGVAYAIWPFGPDDHPFDVQRWFVAPGDESLLLDYLPYYFTVAAHGWWGRSDAPSYALETMTTAGSGAGRVLGLATSGDVVAAAPDEFGNTKRVRVTVLRLPAEDTGGFES